MYICLCNAITEGQIRACAAESGARSLCDLESCLGVGTNCGRCRPAANEGVRSIDELTSRLGVGAGCGRCRECATEMLREACRALQPQEILGINPNAA